MIPKEFTIGGITVTVGFDESLCKDKKMIGEARYLKQQIVIDNSVANEHIIEHCFHHELVHWILYVMNEDELRNNEKFVDVFSQFLYQFHKTKKYEE